MYVLKKIKVIYNSHRRNKPAVISNSLYRK